MNGISENTRYIASYLIAHQDQFVNCLDDQGLYLDEEKLAELLQEYFDNRR